MVLMDGKKIKKEILEELKEEVNKLREKPNFVVIQVGNDKASNTYINQKTKMAEYIGYKYTHLKYDESITEEELLNKITELNMNNNIDGIMVQMPLPKHLNEYHIQNAISHEKDIDGLTDINTGMLVHNQDSLYSCTPSGIMELLNRYNISVKGMNAVVVGRSNLVGKPIAMMLTNADATVTLCHSKTNNLSEYTTKADIIIVAVGKPKIITEDMVKPNAIVIDVGINLVDGKICGDVDFENVSKKASYITPVPGGVGQMTVAMLGQNVIKAYKKRRSKR